MSVIAVFTKDLQFRRQIARFLSPLYMSPRTTFFQQVCPCGQRPAAVAITVFAGTVGVTPRRSSHAVTFYLCEDCLNRPAKVTVDKMCQLIRERGLDAIEH